MRAHTGSVYLDAPTRPSRRPAVPDVSRNRSVSASVMVGIGLVALTITVLIIGFRSLITSPDAMDGAIERALEDPGARAELELEIARGIEQQLIGSEAVEAASAFGVDVRTESARMAPAILEDPAVRLELQAFAEEVHRRTFDDASTAPVDLVPLSNAVRAAIGSESPEMLDIVDPAAELWMVGPQSLTDLTPITRIVDGIAAVALLAVALVPLAAVVHPRHHLVVLWVGRWGLAFGLLCGLAALGLPSLAHSSTGWSTVEAMLRSSADRLIAPAAIAGTVGVGMIALAAIGERRERQRVLDEGAAAALGYDDRGLKPSGVTIDAGQGQHGLVDAARPLTNI